MVSIVGMCEQSEYTYTHTQSHVYRTHTHTRVHIIYDICSHFESKFDLPILLPSIAEYAQQRHTNIDLLKKGTKISHLTMSEVCENDWIQFRDVLSYTSPCSLDRFLKQWNAPQAKGCFPYE